MNEKPNLIVEYPREYRMTAGGGLTLSNLAMSELDWIKGTSQCEQYLDLENQRALLIAPENGFGEMPKEEAGRLWPSFRLWPITTGGFIAIDARIRNKLCWEPGMIFTQVLDRRVPGIWIQALTPGTINVRERNNQ